MGPRSAALGVGKACGRPPSDLRWAALWCHEALCWAWQVHAGCLAGNIGGASYGKRCAGSGGRS
eukprot:6604897-Pyramimonas_sp.AAC.1